MKVDYYHYYNFKTFTVSMCFFIVFPHLVFCESLCTKLCVNNNGNMGTSRDIGLLLIYIYI